MLGLALRIGGRLRDVAGFGSSIDAVFPTEPVRYLQALGVSPSHQGRGIGTALLGDGLARADAAHEAVYLETSLERNVRLYIRHGFTVVPGRPGPLSNGDPVMWRMHRRAKEQRTAADVHSGTLLCHVDGHRWALVPARRGHAR